MVLENINTYINELDRLYIFDNSENSNESLFNSFDEKVVYISENQNMGIAYALNQGANHAIEDGYSWLLTMDQDSRYKSKELKKIIDYIQEHQTENIGLVSPWHVIKTGVKKPKQEVEELIEVMTSGNIIFKSL